MKPIVYTMGKVGSSAVANAINRAGLRCLHVHTLQQHKIDQHLAERKKLRISPMKHIEHAVEMQAIDPKDALYISLVREPVARNISAFMQNINKRLAQPHTPDRACAKFAKRHNLEHPLTWFDLEFRDRLGIDVYQTPFDPARGHAEGANWIVLREDLPDDAKSAVLSARLGVEITIARENLTDTRDTRPIYDALKARIRFGPDMIHRLYASQYARHFWTPAELETFRRRWQQMDAG